MTTPDPIPFGAASEADVIEQRFPVDDLDDESWRDTQRVGSGRDGQASEADLLDQAIAVPDDESGFDR